MSEFIEKSAKAAFGVWREYPPSPAKAAAAWDQMDAALKEPWLRTARAMVEAMEPTAAMLNSAQETALFDIKDYCSLSADDTMRVWHALKAEALK